MRAERAQRKCDSFENPELGWWKREIVRAERAKLGGFGDAIAPGALGAVQRVVGK